MRAGLCFLAVVIVLGMACSANAATMRLEFYGTANHDAGNLPGATPVDGPLRRFQFVLNYTATPGSTEGYWEAHSGFLKLGKSFWRYPVQTEGLEYSNRLSIRDGDEFSPIAVFGGAQRYNWNYKRRYVASVYLIFTPYYWPNPPFIDLTVPAIVPVPPPVENLLEGSKFMFQTSKYEEAWSSKLVSYREREFLINTIDRIVIKQLAPEVASHATPAPVPLPASLWLTGIALAGLGWLRQRRSKAA